MRIDRIARPDALCDASVSAQTSEASDASIINRLDFDEVGDVNITKAHGGIHTLKYRVFGNLAEISRRERTV